MKRVVICLVLFVGAFALGYLALTFNSTQAWSQGEPQQNEFSFTHRTTSVNGDTGVVFHKNKIVAFSNGVRHEHNLNEKGEIKDSFFDGPTGWGWYSQKIGLKTTFPRKLRRVPMFDSNCTPTATKATEEITYTLVRKTKYQGLDAVVWSTVANEKDGTHTEITSTLLPSCGCQVVSSHGLAMNPDGTINNVETVEVEDFAMSADPKLTSVPSVLKEIVPSQYLISKSMDENRTPLPADSKPMMHLDDKYAKANAAK